MRKAHESPLRSALGRRRVPFILMVLAAVGCEPATNPEPDMDEQPWGRSGPSEQRGKQSSFTPEAPLDGEPPGPSDSEPGVGPGPSTDAKDDPSRPSSDPDTKTPTTNTKDPQPAGQGPVGTTPKPTVDMSPSASLYAADQLPHFELELPPESIAALEDDPRAYAIGALTIGDERIEDVGIRLKGEASFRDLDGKAAFKVKFDAFVVDDDLGSVPTLTLVLTEASINENGGGSNATITRNGETTAALTVALVSSNANEATVPATVTIPAGDNSATFIVSAVNDAVADGDQTVTITATATGFVPGIDTIDVLDDDVPQLTLAIAQTSISENGGVSLASVSRNTGTAIPLTVTLTSSDPGEAMVSATVTIAAGQTNSAFLINAIDDTVVDGTQTVTITAQAQGFAAANGTIDITDDDPGSVGSVQLALSIVPASISESGGSATATITRTGAIAGALTVNLTSSDSSEATVPASVVIGAGQSSATFAVTAVDDSVADGVQTVTITASASGADPVSASVSVTDNEGSVTDAIFSNDFED